ncbi:hypothetical protein ISU10_17255 [Nocardioides agariphilus]|jgi:hypothetical protein|uniref:Intracellular septation protein A n=1 Tax=Nocardioides agariphilus TaxID=433664 RepID=A0A930VL45_9ACTN|nr:VC0807 family protein [Nocardioides agariphilus]MBF4769519.1 hypothetical protein [Nocardioides agariphilus]
MNQLQDRDVVPVEVPSRPAMPQLQAIVARTVMSIVTAVVVPAMLFCVAMVVFNVDTALVVALGWMVAALCWRRGTGRPMSGLLVLALAIMAVKTGFTLLTGNTFVYFVQPVFVDAVVALLFVASLWSATPAVARIAPDFYPLDAALAARPGIRRLFRHLTMLWALVIAIKGTVTLWLLLSLSTVSFVLVKSSAILALTVLATVATITLSAVVGRREGLLRPASAD